MNNNKLLHESKKHGQDNFDFSIYHSFVPCHIEHFPIHWHDEIEITYMVDGVAKFTICNEEFTAHKGDILIANSKYPHSMTKFLDKKANFFSILVNINLIKNESLIAKYRNLIDEVQASKRIFPNFIKNASILNNKLKPFLEDLIEKRKECYADSQLDVFGNLFFIFNHLLTNSFDTDKSTDEFQYDFSKIKPAVYAVSNRYEQKLTVDDMATLCCLSKSHFMKLFKSITGKPFTEYLIEHRLSMATLMLRKTKDKLIDIAYACGFENQSYFTRSFTRHFSMTPREFRNKHQLSKNEDKTNNKSELFDKI